MVGLYPHTFDNGIVKSTIYDAMIISTYPPFDQLANLRSSQANSVIPVTGIIGLYISGDSFRRVYYQGVVAADTEHGSLRVMSALKFKLLARAEGSFARCGRMHLPHGLIETPVFMPVGTQATVKAMTPRDLEEIDAQIILGNTYHLMLRPGAELIEQMGGLHRFMAWDGPILTDSGGFQVWSLGNLRKIEPHGVRFRSHINGDEVFLGPKESMDIQRKLGSDIVMTFDECTPYPATEGEARTSMELSMRWARECREHLNQLQNSEGMSGNPTSSPFLGWNELHGDSMERNSSSEMGRSGEANRRSRILQLAHPPPSPEQALFGIVQGGMYPGLRLESLQQLSDIGFEGIAIGGLSVGEPKEDMLSMLDTLASHLPQDKPRYLMGVGTPADLIEGIDRGIDMFDCVMPTRNARNGTLFTDFGTIHIKQARFRDDSRPLVENCKCYACQHFSRAYLRHLYVSREILSSRLNTVHNLHYYCALMRRARASIEAGQWPEFRDQFLRGYHGSQDISGDT